MEILINSLLLFWTSVLYGFWIQSAYQLILGFRIVIPRMKLLYWVEDLLFWGMAALFTYQMFYKMNYGQIRGYAVAGLLLGMLISFFTVGALLKSISGRIRQIYLKIKRKINRRRQKRREKKKAEREVKREKREKKRAEREAKREKRKKKISETEEKENG